FTINKIILCSMCKYFSSSTPIKDASPVLFIPEPSEDVAPPVFFVSEPSAHVALEEQIDDLTHQLFFYRYLP
ncbi:unnamed protein product, partial [Rotaria magnacalcarata]